MSAIDERVASIRMFTVPRRPVEVVAVYRYAAVAADWERLRLQGTPQSAAGSSRRRAVFRDERDSAEVIDRTWAKNVHHHDGEHRRHCRDHGLAGVPSQRSGLPVFRYMVPVHREMVRLQPS